MFIPFLFPGINACNLIKLKPQAKISERNISCIISGKYINFKNKAEGILGEPSNKTYIFKGHVRSRGGGKTLFR